MNQNVDLYAKSDGQSMESAGDRQAARSLSQQMRGLLARPAVDAAITGAVVAAVIFNIPEALLGAAAGVTVYAIRQRRCAAKGKSLTG
jgi:hypothetical protein